MVMKSKNAWAWTQIKGFSPKSNQKDQRERQEMYIFIYLGRADIRDGSKEEEEEEKRRLRVEELAEEIRQPAEDSLERLEMFRSGGGVENHRFHGSLLLPRSSSKIDDWLRQTTTKTRRKKSKP